MQDEAKTKAQLINELIELRKSAADAQSTAAEFKRLKESNEKFLKAFMHSSIPMAITVMEDGRYIDVNGAFVKVIGLKREELLGNTSIGAGFITAETRALFVDTFLKKGFVENLELPMHVRGGELRYGLFNSSEIAIGGQDFFLTTVTDITEQKRIQEALRQSKEKYSTIFRLSPIIISLSTLADGRYVEANDLWLTTAEYTREEVIGHTAAEINIWVNPEDRRRMMQTIREQGVIRDQEYLFWTKSGKTNTLLFTAGVIEISGVPHIISLALSITARKKMEEERKRAEEAHHKLEKRLQRAEKMEALGTLAGGVAHDLNNILGVLVGYSELLAEKLPKDSPLRKYPDNILQSSIRGAAIVQDLLTLARRGVTTSEVINLNKEVCDYLQTPEFKQLELDKPGVKISIELEEELLNIKGSPIHLGKSIMNLVFNAVEAIAEKGAVTLRTENRHLDHPIKGYDEMKEGDYVVLSVSDNGQGIAQQDIGKIFEPFFTKKVMGKSGTGLGLAVVWGTVKDHQGYIDVQSEEGKGSIFTIYFPATREETEKSEKAISPEAYIGRGESILVVDDVKEQRELAISMLERLGYQVEAVAGGKEAIEYLKNKKVDLIVLDMIMVPGMDGMETYRRILEINSCQKAVIVSGFSATDQVRKTLEMGAGAFVRKPYILEKIGNAVRKELDRKG